MARSKTNPLTSVTFRMPDETLHKIEELAALNSHDRTSEIIGACRHWINIGGNAGIDISTKDKIAELQSHVISLEKTVSEISLTMIKLEENNTTLLRIIEKMSNK
ncbi:MAG: hypothetical protein Q4Q53_06355 [Methanocorpusculum sp.]|nr:hypothetical protein [Methanocorpusculum sp.]